MPDDLIIHDRYNAFDRLVEFLYPDLLLECNKQDYLKVQTILALTLEIVNEVNNSMMEDFHGFHDVERV
ncbi:hypothetical protein AHAS_Ahas20G0235100 [Arachis hypogaea]